MLADGLQEGLPVALQLDLPNPAEPGEIVQCRRPVADHRGEGGVAEDDVGRDALVAGEFEA